MSLYACQRITTAQGTPEEGVNGDRDRVSAAKLTISRLCDKELSYLPFYRAWASWISIYLLSYVLLTSYSSAPHPRLACLSDDKPLDHGRLRVFSSGILVQNRNHHHYRPAGVDVDHHHHHRAVSLVEPFLFLPSSPPFRRASKLVSLYEV
jgi:hypothetical protein